MRDVYAMTRRVDPSIRWWMLGALVIPFVVFEAVGLLTGHWIYFGIIGLLFSVLAALFVLARRAESAAYKSLEGQPGAAGAALRTLRRGWLVEEEPVAIDPRTRDTVFRLVGRPGVVLVGDGPRAPGGEAARRRAAPHLPRAARRAAAHHPVRPR